MTKHSDSHNPALYSLVDNLLDCAGVLRRIIEHMETFHAAGLSDLGALPIEVVLHGLVADVSAPVVGERPASDLELASTVIHELTEAMRSEILLVSLESPQS